MKNTGPQLMLIHFPLIYLFFSWYLICLVYIALCMYQFTFHVRYFPHIILIHPTNSLIFFLSFLSSSPIYSYWTSLDPWFMRFSTHIAFYTWGYGFLSLGILSLVSFHFFHPITLAYISSHILRPPWVYDITHCVW